jgi:hypothetical protein
MRTTTDGEISRVPALRRTVRGDGAFLELWFALAGLNWMSLVLVPGHPGGSADEAARMLAEVGQKVSGLPVRSVTFSSLDYASALALNDLQEQLRRVVGEEVPALRAVEVGSSEVTAEESEAPPAAPTTGLVSVPPAARFVISIPCILSEPIGLAALQGADAVVVLAEKGLSRLDDLERIVAQAGRERVAACFLVS